MKKILFVIYLLLGTLNLVAQIKPVEQIDESKGEIETQIKGITHIKDVNGVLDRFVGTWKGTFDGKRLEIVVKKYTRDISQAVKSYHPIGLKWDQLVLKHKITDQNGTVLYSTLNLGDDNPALMQKDEFRNSYTYTFHYDGKDYKCGDNGYVSFYLKDNNTQGYFSYIHRGAQSPSCQTSVDPVFPNDQGILLTKQ